MVEDGVQNNWASFWLFIPADGVWQWHVGGLESLTLCGQKELSSHLKALTSSTSFAGAIWSHGILDLKMNGSCSTCEGSLVIVPEVLVFLIELSASVLRRPAPLGSCSASLFLRWTSVYALDVEISKLVYFLFQFHALLQYAFSQSGDLLNLTILGI